MSKARQLADLGSVTTRLDEVGNTDGALSNRNLIINGAMQVAQRGTSSTSDGYQTIDRWRPASINTGQLVHTYSQSTDAPSGFSTSFKVNVDTAETTLDADESFKFEQRIEGQNLQMLAKGTPDAKALTVSFWVKSSTTGTYICELDDRDNTRAYSQAYTINSADTWEYKTLTYAGDTTGALDNDNDQSFRLTFMLAAGSNYTSGTLTTGWASRVDANRFVGQTNLMATANNYWQITGVQLEVGDTATPFEHEPHSVTLQKCQRFYEETDVGRGLQFSAISSTQSRSQGVPFKVEKRANPTISQKASFSWDYWNGTGHTTLTSISYYANKHGFSVSSNGTGLGAKYRSSQTAQGSFDSATSRVVVADCEL